MEEPPGGPNAGRRAAPETKALTYWQPLATEGHQSAEFVREGGWSIVTRGGGEWQRSGGTAHRGTLHPEEHVDEAAVLALVEAEFGFTAAELHSVYSTGGRIPSDRRELRGRIDARLLALSRSGANMELFRGVVGLAHRTLHNALARARAEEATP